MARMLGREFRSPPDPRDLMNDPVLCRRIQRHRERQALGRECAAGAFQYGSAEGKLWLERRLAETESWPGWDFSGCQHGCSGSPSCGERCTFMCHAEM